MSFNSNFDFPRNKQNHANNEIQETANLDSDIGLTSHPIHAHACDFHTDIIAIDFILKI